MANKPNPAQRKAERKAARSDFSVTNTGQKPKGEPLSKSVRKGVDFNRVAGVRTRTKPGRD